MITGIFAGVGVYFVACAFKRKWPEVLAAMECGACGGGIVAGAHLTYCAIFPDHLVHLLDDRGAMLRLSELFIRDGEQFKQAGLALNIDMLHTAHIILGGVATFVIALGGLVAFCRDIGRAKTSRH